MEALLIAALVAFASKLTDLAKYISAKDWNAAGTQVVAWLIGIATLAVAGASDLTKGLTVPGLDVTLGSIDFVGLVLLGLSATSILSKVVDVTKAIDQNDSAKTPPLFK
jgi:hypothetical protein